MRLVTQMDRADTVGRWGGGRPSPPPVSRTWRTLEGFYDFYTSAPLMEASPLKSLNRQRSRATARLIGIGQRKQAVALKARRKSRP